MDKSEKELLELYLKVDPIIEKLIDLLKNTNLYHYNLIVSDLYNLPEFVKKNDEKMINKLKFLQNKSLAKKINNSEQSIFSSGELNYLDSCLTDDLDYDNF